MVLDRNKTIDIREWVDLWRWSVRVNLLYFQVQTKLLFNPMTFLVFLWVFVWNDHYAKLKVDESYIVDTHTCTKHYFQVQTKLLSNPVAFLPGEFSEMTIEANSNIDALRISIVPRGQNPITAAMRMHEPGGLWELAIPELLIWRQHT